MLAAFAENVTVRRENDVSSILQDDSLAGSDDLGDD